MAALPASTGGAERRTERKAERRAVALAAIVGAYALTLLRQ